MTSQVDRLLAELEADAAPRTDDHALIQRAMDRALSPGWEPKTRQRPLSVLLAAALFVGVAGAAFAAVQAIPRGQVLDAPHTPSRIPSSTPSAVPRPAAPAVSAAPLPSPSAPQGPTPTLGPEALFSLGNAARRAGQSTQALAFYQELESRYPASREATTTHVIVAQILLARGRPREALARFDVYLARGGPLSEEARLGRAESWRALGDTTGEAQAWEELLRAHPQTIHAEQARIRLEALR